MLVITQETPCQREIIRILQHADAYLESLYPGEASRMLDIMALSEPEARFFVAREEGQVIGCGALIRSAHGQGELKRIFVEPTHRARGVGRAIIQHTEAVALREGLRVIRLETGTRQPEALRLYQNAGYTNCEPFGCYELDPLSVFFEKCLL
jgi:putative acetyltransferase